ncbi:hypothetical protein, variant 3 [Phytophthora nicotianae CJ01A1]|uniref:AMMECR1 domain-containing protein n=6 Tax=Phytophthora nicotianae TaxID=4792 RepID=W2PUZ9_PHYN3|nr:hypothetical protein, variant 3 [Phytophthora nicotianae INRA-310]ETI39755.1 hypothetical protein, variant 3 [Phytophthora nicotianae P1569]ETK79933.1 hypothetical protein, variant 3 [Phytophthora nicotianae]ETO68496.1 hypothetical protein, variant 3 [Phytophthora nicotianae P1976]ETP09662.1 hypothetical protein, variant 3 [Phytophthora nicotianae CJ01A1]ETP37729.1 hypothetical protein, variant 3 [Phytophthora nicotianae P10297]
MASAAMVVYCFDTLQSHFEQGAEPTPRFDVHQEYPLFVTWEIEEYGGTHLRGCIGTLTPTRLRNLRDFTLKSALRDHRFDPIEPQELQRLHCSVSLLLDYKGAESYDDWEVDTFATLFKLLLGHKANRLLHSDWHARDHYQLQRLARQRVQCHVFTASSAGTGLEPCRDGHVTHAKGRLPSQRL